ncbi:transposable element Tcb2 transposase [Trichonephila clavipes]|nr:transposable element Tcb2 transposase [Trichonephila clavipes]
MTAQWYAHDVLQSHALPLMQWLSGAIFQQDNTRPHTVRVCQDCLRTVTALPRPALSPDLSPIEHTWDHLGWQRKKSKESTPKSLSVPPALFAKGKPRCRYVIHDAAQMQPCEDPPLPDGLLSGLHGAVIDATGLLKPFFEMGSLLLPRGN